MSATLPTDGAETTGSAAPPGASFVARQPIYDRSLEVHAYELLFRENGGDRLVETIEDVGLDALLGARSGFVSVTQRFVLGDHALLIPADRVALQVLDELAGDPLDKLRALAAQGYLIVLDDYAPERTPEALLGLAHIVKVDVAGRSREELAGALRRLTPHRVKVLARNVDDYDRFELCKRLGFDYFQGPFFTTPRRLDDEETIPAGKLSRVQLVAALQDPEVELAALEAIISHDVGLSYRLLRYINSGFFYLPHRLTSIHDALVRLGRRNVQLWSTLIVLSETDDRPNELLVTALVRARLCELIAAAREQEDAHASFTVGLFSVIDAYMDASLPTILAALPFSEEVQAALVAHEGVHGNALAAVLAYEQGRFAEVEQRLPDCAARDLYLEAVRWAEDTSASLQGLS